MKPRRSKQATDLAFKIAVLPGDGVGKEVVEATRTVLDALAVDAEYVHGDIGWEFWRTEGNALPDQIGRAHV